MNDALMEQVRRVLVEKGMKPTAALAAAQAIGRTEGTTEHYMKLLRQAEESEGNENGEG